MTRTAKSVKNAKVVLFFYFINLVLQFFSRKIFLEYLGAEVLGLNTTVQNLIESCGTGYWCCCCLQSL